MVVGDFPIELDTVVVGAGPGGYVAAIRAAQLGQKVAIIEKANLGGVCLNVGCIPSKALINAGHRYENAMHSDDMGMTEDAAQTYTFKNAVLATGSTPIEIPGFKYSKRVINSTGALSLPEIPKKLVVIGDGYIGIELGPAYANFVTEVTVVEAGDEILAGFEKAMSTVVKRALQKKGNVNIHTKAMAK